MFPINSSDNIVAELFFEEGTSLTKIEENAKADNEAKAELDTKIDTVKSELEKDITDLTNGVKAGYSLHN